MRRRSREIFDKSFESFLGVVTKNGLGMLILVAMASTFTSEQTLSEAKFRTPPSQEKEKTPVAAPKVRKTLSTPLYRLAPAGAKSVFFECLGERLFPVDLRAAGFANADREFFDAYRKGKNMEQLAQQMNAQAIPHDYYRFEFRAKGGEAPFIQVPIIVCHPKQPGMGEPLDEALKEGSVFRQKIKEFLPGVPKDLSVVYLRVWPDSFALFRELREHLEKEGYLTTWEPANKPLWLGPPGPAGTLWIG
jgi:hypothetical protein